MFVLGIVRFIQGGWVHPGASWGSSGAFGVVAFTAVRPACRRVHSESLGSLGCAQGGPQVNSRSLGSRRCALEVLWFVGFTRVCCGCRRVHSGSLGRRGCALGIVGFIRCRCFHLVTLLCSMDSFWVHPGGYSGCLGSHWCALGVVGLIRTRVRPVGRNGSLDSRGLAMEIVGFNRGRWVKAGASSVSQC